jgi:hypothetical protein
MGKKNSAASPTKKKKQLKADIPENVQKPEEFLEPQGQRFPYIPEEYIRVQNENDDKIPFPPMKAKDAKCGDLVYAVFGESKVASCFLGKVIYSSEKGCRINFVDAHMHAGLEEPDDLPYNDFVPAAPMYRASRNGEDSAASEKWTRVSKGSVDQDEALAYLNRNPTIKKQSVRGARTKIMAAAIMLAADEAQVTEQAVTDAYKKAKEEGKDDGEVVGMDYVNIRIVKEFFDYQQPKDAGLNPEVTVLLKQLLGRMSNLEELVGKTKKITMVTESIAKEPKEKADMLSMPGDGSCLYWLLASIEALTGGKTVSEVRKKKDEEMLHAVQAQIVENGWQIRQQFTSGDPDSEWFNLVGESQHEFNHKVTKRSRAGDKELYGGHVEAMVYGWRSQTALVIINADGITNEMSVEDAQSQVVDAPWPDDGREYLENAAVAVCSDGHYFLMVKGEQGVFKLGSDEYHSVLMDGLAIIKAQKEARPSLGDIEAVKDKGRRIEMLRELSAAPKRLVATKPKNKPSKKKRGGGGDGGSSGGGSGSGAGGSGSGSGSGSSAGSGGGGGGSGGGSNNGGGASGGGGAGNASSANRSAGGSSGGGSRGGGGGEPTWKQIAEQNGWQPAGPRKPRTVVRRQQQAPPARSAVVIYTQDQAEELLEEIARCDENTANLVVSTRQKEGHVVLMAAEEDVQALKEAIPGLRDWGFQVKEYLFKPGTLAISADQGWKAQAREAGVCNNWLAKRECPFKDQCKFKCYG